MTKESHSRFRHEDVSAVPKGWRVRTVAHGNHRIRLAFPPGRKQVGMGKAISVLHPLGENPCTLKSVNPQDLMVMGANPPRRNRNWVYRVVAIARSAGSNIVRDFEKKKDAQSFARTINRKDYFHPNIRNMPSRENNPAQELLILGANPRVEIVHSSNPQPETICEEFSGAPCGEVSVENEPHMPRGRYAELGLLLALYIKPMKGGQVLRINGFGNNPPLVVTDSTARQIYFVGGAQDISGCLETFGAVDRGGSLFELGGGRRIDYQARKEHVAEPDQDQWKHDFGEENGKLPTVLFDASKKRILLEGGDYRIEGAWIRN